MSINTIKPHPSQAELQELFNYQDGNLINRISRSSRAYDIAALEHYGRFAQTNFPRENYQQDKAA